MLYRGVGIAAESHGVQITLIDFTLSRLCTIDGSGAYCDLDADPELFQGPKGDCQVHTTLGSHLATMLLCGSTVLSCNEVLGQWSGMG